MADDQLISSFGSSEADGLDRSISSPMPVSPPPARSDVPEPAVQQPYELRGKPDAGAAVTDMLSSVSQYFMHEMKSHESDLTLLQMLNENAKARYGELCAHGGRVVDSFKELERRYEMLQPYFEKVDQIESSTSDLERSLHFMDEYSKNLEQRFFFLLESLQKERP